MSNDLEHIIHEAKKQVKNEKLLKLAKKHKSKIIKSSIIGTLALVSFLAFNVVQNIRNEKFSKEIHQSLLDERYNKMDVAISRLEKIHKAKFVSSNIKSITLLRYAALLGLQNKNDKAIEIYNELSNCSSCNEFSRELARLFVAKLLLSNPEKIKDKKLLAKIDEFEKKSSYLKYNLVEQKAILEFANKDYQKSAKDFDLIKSQEKISPTLKERANNQAQLLLYQLSF